MQVENMVSIELAYINTKHPDFQREASLVSSLMLEDHAASTNKKSTKKISVPLSNASQLANGDNSDLSRVSFPFPVRLKNWLPNLNLAPRAKILGRPTNQSAGNGIGFMAE